MSMKYLFSTLFISSCLILGGCDIVGDLLYPPDVYFKSFVYEYANVDYSQLPEVEVWNKTIAIALPQMICARQNVWGRGDIDVQKLHTKHQEISQRNGDIDFNRWEHSDHGLHPNVRVWNTDTPFSAITVVSSADFDAGHPSGTFLNDVIDIEYYTYRFYIENGYKHTDPERMYVSNDYSGDAVTKSLLEWGKEDSKFMDNKLYHIGLSDAFEPTFTLTLTSVPTLEQHHSITVSIIIDGEEPYVFECEMDFAE